MKTTPWTCIEGSTLWDVAAAQYARNGHAYHNMDHIGRMYTHAAHLGLPYDADLDRAILAHDVIMDGQGDHEVRSADWLDVGLQTQGENLATYPRYLIETTITHDIDPEVVIDRRLVLLDLADFMDKWQRRTNTRLLRDEAMRNAETKGDTFDHHAWVHGTLTYLKGLHERITTGMQSLPDENERHFWSRISRGIAVTMATMPYEYAPHPAECIQRYTRSMEEILRFIAVKPGIPENEILELAEETDFWANGLRTLGTSIMRLKDEDLILMRRIKGVACWQATEKGLDWIARMDAPSTEWPEPGPSV